VSIAAGNPEPLCSMKLGLDGLEFQKRGSIMESPKSPNMGRRKEKKNRPWLNVSGQDIPTSELKLISKSWDSSTWEEYLKWFESSRREPHISRRRYDILLESQTQTIFEQNEVSCPQEFADVCETLLKSLPYKEEQILRHFYLAGRTQSEISQIVGI
jgi:hypothetical protein